MAKISFTKLGLKVKSETKTIQIEGNDIEVKQYLGIQEKLNLIGRVVSLAVDQSNNFINPVQVEAIGAIEIVDAYTNIGFTEKQKDDIPKLYDTLETNDVITAVFAAIPKAELDFVLEGIDDTVAAIYQYHQSALGIIETISTDYKDLNLDSQNIEQNLSNPENLSLVKDILTKLG